MVNYSHRARKTREKDVSARTQAEKTKKAQQESCCTQHKKAHGIQRLGSLLCKSVKSALLEALKKIGGVGRIGLFLIQKFLVEIEG